MNTPLYERVGGREFFFDLVNHFYDGIAGDPLLRPLYPKELAGPRERLALFLIQYFGGPNDYDVQRGEPRLRLRHMRFPIDKRSRDAWLRHMTAAIEKVTSDPLVADELTTYFSQTASFLVNQGLAIGGNS